VQTHHQQSADGTEAEDFVKETKTLIIHTLMRHRDIVYTRHGVNFSHHDDV